MERKIGEVFTEGDVKLQVVTSKGCNECFYNNLKCFSVLSSNNRGDCHAIIRSDKNSVIFKELKT